VLVLAPGDGPNIDGIYITESTNVVLQDCKLNWKRFSNLIHLFSLLKGDFK
jgi:polygalacturonase